MTSNKIYDLQERTYLFARDCRLKIQQLKKTISNIEDGKQLVKSSGSIAANEKLGDKDFVFRLKFQEKKLKNLFYG